MSDRHFYAGVSRRRLIQGAATMGLLAGFDSCYRPMLGVCAAGATFWHNT